MLGMGSKTTEIRFLGPGIPQGYIVPNGQSIGENKEYRRRAFEVRNNESELKRLNIERDKKTRK